MNLQAVLWTGCESESSLMRTATDQKRIWENNSGKLKYAISQQNVQIKVGIVQQAMCMTFEKEVRLIQ